MAKDEMDVFDIIGPVMVGPSSSHTAGAVRLGLLARGVLGSEPKSAVVHFYGSFATTWRGHGTDRAIVAGMLGMKPDDERISKALEMARQKKIKIKFIPETTIADQTAPRNLIKIEMISGKGEKCEIIGESIGGGEVVLTFLDGYPVEINGEYETLIAKHHDEPGVIANITSVFASVGINIARINSYRRHKGEEAIVVIEVDGTIPPEVIKVISAIHGIYQVRLIAKIK